MISALSIASSCMVVKPYQMAKINSEDMSMNSSVSSTMESNFQSYREGAAGANGGKVGGGCGCN